MTSTPTLEDFLSQPSTVEDDVDGPDSTEPNGDPLESIAASLRTLVERLPGESFTAELAESEPTVPLSEYDDLEDRYRSLFDVMAEVEKIVKTSTSKVSLAVKDAIEAWRNPQVPEAATEPAAELAGDPSGPPAHDADVEEWRAYARSLGYAGAPVDEGNRSQIRTLLGVAQPVDGE